MRSSETCAKWTTPFSYIVTDHTISHLSMTLSERVCMLKSFGLKSNLQTKMFKYSWMRLKRKEKKKKNRTCLNLSLFILFSKYFLSSPKKKSRKADVDSGSSGFKSDKSFCAVMTPTQSIHTHLQHLNFAKLPRVQCVATHTVISFVAL